MRIGFLSKNIKQSFSFKELKRKSEQRIAQKIKLALNPTFVSVQNTTLGANSCGQMFKIVVQSPFFKRKTKVEQHLLVTDVLSSQIQNIHGFNLKTRQPKLI